MVKKTKTSALTVRTAMGVGRDSAALPAFKDLPEDMVGEVLRHLRPGTARLVSKRQRDACDSARTSLCVWGLGRLGQPARVADRCPNLTDLTVSVKEHDLSEAYAAMGPHVNWVGRFGGALFAPRPDGRLPDFLVIPWETYIDHIVAGMRAWADACASLRHLRYLHLDIEPVLCLLPAATERSLAELFFRRAGLRQVSVGSWKRIRANLRLYKMPVADFWKEAAASEAHRARPILSLLR